MGILGTILIAVAILVIPSLKKRLNEEVIGEFDDTIDIENDEGIESFSTSSLQQKQNAPYQQQNELSNTEKEKKEKQQQINCKEGDKSKFDLKKAVIYSTILDRPYK